MEKMSDSFMARALQLARLAAQRGEVPVGAVLVKDGTIVAEAHNETEASGNPTRHGEMLVIERGIAALRDHGDHYRLEGCDLYVTLEPCAMCAGAIAWTRIRTVYFGAYDPKGGAIDHGPRLFRHNTCLHVPDVYGGIDERSASALLSDFFQKCRKKGEKSKKETE